MPENNTNPNLNQKVHLPILPHITLLRYDPRQVKIEAFEKPFSLLIPVKHLSLIITHNQIPRYHSILNF